MPTTKPRKILYIDLDNTLVDFPSGIKLSTTLHEILSNAAARK